MRVQKLPVLALALAAGLSLTACGGDDSSSASSNASSQSQGSTEDTTTTGPTTSTDDSTGSNSANPEDTTTAPTSAPASCKTSQLDFRSTHGMGEGTMNISLKNTGSATCTLQGFAGVDLKGKDGTVSATRSDRDAPRAHVEPGEETNFTLYYPPDTSGGSGTTFTSLVVTPPDETRSHTLPVEIVVRVSDDSGTSGTRVDPVGTGK